MKAAQAACGRLPSFLRNKVFWRVLEHLGIFSTFVLPVMGQLVLFARLLPGGTNDVTSWGFGQIVAVALWVPMLVEYAYLQYREFV